jgi:hypothetical protein
VLITNTNNITSFISLSQSQLIVVFGNYRVAGELCTDYNHLFENGSPLSAIIVMRLMLTASHYVTIGIIIACGQLGVNDGDPSKVFFLLTQSSTLDAGGAAAFNVKNLLVSVSM